VEAGHVETTSVARQPHIICALRPRPAHPLELLDPGNLLAFREHQFNGLGEPSQLAIDRCIGI
jgi:hypothetical protein